jgi:DNA modification methylase
MTDVTHIRELQPDPANRRKHTPRNLGMLVDALHAVGAARSIVVDEANVVLAGNGVVEAAGEAGITKVRVVEASGDEVIAVRRTGLSDAQKRALALYDNRTAELAEWNVEQLAQDISEGLDLQPWFLETELRQLVPEALVKPGLTDPDVVPAVRPTGIQRGDLFELGTHRLLCGDSTQGADVARLLGDVVPMLMVTDPPYGVDYAPNWRNDAAKKGLIAYGATRVATVANDTCVDWGSAWELSPASVCYCWYASCYGSVVQSSLERARYEIRSQIIWAKPRFAISRGHYHWQHEACWYAVRHGAIAGWIGDRSQTTLWSVGLDKNIEGGHGTQKPVECMQRPMRNHEAPAVYDPFCGSGTSIVAAEQIGRACYAIEILPEYCQVTIDRWEAFTGQTARKVGGA